MISVVMPAYNSERYIAAAIESILNQTMADFEFIIVDDGSTDSTLQIIQCYAAKDARIRVIHNDHGGASHAMNTGIAAACGEWVVVMHSDDVSMPNRLERLMHYAKAAPEVVIWGSNGIYLSATDRKMGSFFVGPTSSADFHSLREKAEIVQVIHPTAMMRRDLLLKLNSYDETIRVAEDIELFDRLALHGELRTIDEPLIQYRIHRQSLSMLYFMEMHALAEYIRERQRCRLANRAIPDREAFLADFRNQPRPKQIRIMMSELSRLHYRNAGAAIGEGRPLGAVYHTALAVTLNPRYAVQRVWRQVLSSRARQRLRMTGDSV